MNKCPHCPVKLGPCVAERPGHAFACDMAARGTEAELRWIADASGVEPPLTPEPPALKPAVDFAELRDATKLGSKNCWFSEPSPGCGCNGLHCHLLGRRINIYDCVECLRRW